MPEIIEIEIRHPGEPEITVVEVGFRGPAGAPGVGGAQISAEPDNALTIKPDGLFVDAEQGPKGPQGDPGPDGAPGAKGPAGDKGPTGDTGSRGADWLPGPQGGKGTLGDKGVAGDPGSKGPLGDKGPVGDNTINGG